MQEICIREAEKGKGKERKKRRKEKGRKGKGKNEEKGRTFPLLFPTLPLPIFLIFLSHILNALIKFDLGN